MSSKNRIAIATALLIATALSACGKKETVQDSQAANTTNTPAPPYNYYTGTGTSTGTGTGTGDNSGLPAASYSFSITGDGSYTSPSFSTDNSLQVRFTPGAAGRNNIPGVYSNYNGTYGCIAVDLRITGFSGATTTDTLAVGEGSFACSGAQKSQIIDLSGLLTSGHPAKMTITVENTRTSTFCEMCYWFWWAYGYSSSNPFSNNYGCFGQCPLKTQYQYNTMSGKIEIKGNGQHFL